MYRIIAADWIPELEMTIEEMMVNGWKPIGGVSVVGFSNGVTKFYQAVVKVEFV